MVWVETKNVIFSVRSAYHLAKDLCSRNESGCSSVDSLSPLWKRIWRISCPRVISLFLSQACNNILLTNENLFKRRTITDPLCPVCRLDEETVGHVLWSCPAARDVWLKGNVKIQKSCNAKDTFCNILQKLSERLTGEEFDLVACVARQIWLQQNKLIFEDTFSHPKLVFKAACDQMEFHKQVTEGLRGEHKVTCGTVEEKWKPPPRGISKVNWDAAIDVGKKLMGVGVVVRDSTGGVLATQCMTKPFVRDPGVAEAMALRTALMLLGQLGITKTIMEGDSLEVVQAMKREECSWARYGPILEETKELLQGFCSWDICHVRRSANEVAHRLAKLAVSQNVNHL